MEYFHITSGVGDDVDALEEELQQKPKARHKGLGRSVGQHKQGARRHDPNDGAGERKRLPEELRVVWNQRGGPHAARFRRSEPLTLLSGARVLLTCTSIARACK